VSDTHYVLTTARPTGGAPDLTSLRGWAVADAYARFRRQARGDVLLVPGLGVGPAGDGAAASDVLDALGIAIDADRLPALDDPAVERWGRWLLEQLEASGSIYQRADEGWRLRGAKAHEESERRLDELADWSKAALAGQRKLLEHVDDPGDSGTDLEQSLSKLAAAGWSVDAKKDKGPATIYYAAGDLPLVRGDDWRGGALAPRFAAALAVLLAALPADRRDDPPPGDPELLAGLLPALAIVGPDAGEALLDLRTVAKALRDAGGLALPDGEPLGPVLAHAKLGLRAAPSSNGSAPDAAVDATAPAALVAAHGGDAVRFALLHAAAPAKRFHAGADVVGYAAAFLGRLCELATARLDGAAAGDRIDADDELRRRLAGWCDTAVARTAENYERLDMHRATRNAIALLARIDDFAARAAERAGGELAGADREAVAVALTVLARLLVPLAPAAAGELWKRAGRDGELAEAGWPTAQRELAAA
jgi:hypothetical protein